MKPAAPIADAPRVKRVRPADTLQGKKMSATFPGDLVREKVFIAHEVLLQAKVNSRRRLLIPIESHFPVAPNGAPGLIKADLPLKGKDTFLKISYARIWSR
jgi:hypothetical protein